MIEANLYKKANRRNCSNVVMVGQGPTLRLFVVCAAMGAVASFLTPIGHHGYLLILKPGQYTFGDFLRGGVPLTVLIAITTAWMARWMWLGGPLVPGGLGL